MKTGDKVKILAGKDKGKIGKVIQVFPQNERVVVEGANLLTKHIRSSKRGEKGQKITLPAPLHISNVAVLSPKDEKPTRIGYKILEDGKKVRICKRTKEVI